MLDTYQVGVARRLDRRDWRAAKLTLVVLGGALAQVFGFSFHFEPNMTGAWFFIWFAALPLTIYIVSRLIEVRWRKQTAKRLASLALVVESAGAIISAPILVFYLIVMVVNVRV
jgi:hypothetical protein